MSNPSLTRKLERIISFIKETFARESSQKAVIGVSGGIDSAIALTLLTSALGREAVIPALLPMGSQPMVDATLICEHLAIERSQWHQSDIQPIVDHLCQIRAIKARDQLRRGNVIARVRMIYLYDLAKEHQALVCGTENKSERWLGYFTRFGDAASDLEPLRTLYKTEIWEAATILDVPASIINKPPSADLWPGQTDEAELGFDYRQADAVLRELIDRKTPAEKIRLPDIAPELVTTICQRVKNQAFKQAVPYTME